MLGSDLRVRLGSMLASRSEAQVGSQGWEQRSGVGSGVIDEVLESAASQQPCAPSAPAVFAQPIVSRARPELLHSHFIPTIGRLRKRAGKVVAEEEQLRLEAKAEAEEGELLVRDEFSVLCRDLYALYPLLIRYVDNNRSACPQLSPHTLQPGLWLPWTPSDLSL